MRLTETDYKRLVERNKQSSKNNAALPIGKSKRPAKYRSVITVVNGIKFRSKLEARFYSHLLQLQALGIVTRIHRQVLFDLPGGITYAADFQVFYRGGLIRYFDTKGYETPEFIMKKKQVEALYKYVYIELIKAGNF